MFTDSALGVLGKLLGNCSGDDLVGIRSGTALELLRRRFAREVLRKAYLPPFFFFLFFGKDSKECDREYTSNTNLQKW